MGQKNFEQSKVFMILNCILFLFIAWLLDKVPFVNRHDIIGTLFYILMITVIALIIYKVNHKIYMIIQKNKK